MAEDPKIQSPGKTAPAVVTRHFPLRSGAEVFVTGEHVFTDSMYAGLDNPDQAQTGDWHEVGLQLGYDSGARWTAVLFVDNLLDENYFERGWENGDGANEFGYGVVNTKVWPAQERVFGARLDYRFGDFGS